MNGLLTQFFQGMSVLLFKGEFHDGTNSLTDLRVHRLRDIWADIEIIFMCSIINNQDI